MSGFRARLWFGALVALSAFPAVAQEAQKIPGYAVPWQLDLLAAAAPVKERIHEMHNWLLVLITAITVFVLALLTYTCVRFSAKRHPVASKTTHNTMLEVVWTAIPTIIMIVIVIKSIPLLAFQVKVPPQTDMTIKAVGHQWYWEYEYPDHGGFKFDSNILSREDAAKAGDPNMLGVDNRVVVPVNATVRVQLTSADVIHAWAMPNFGVKTDAVPGRLNETWFKATEPGLYYGQCSELCGVKHGFMPIAVEVVSKEQFDAWVAQAKQKFAANGTALVAQAAR